MLDLYLEVTEVRKTPSGIIVSLSRPKGVEEVPPPESEEEAMMFQVVRAMEKYMKLPVTGISQMQVPTVTITLTVDEYEKLGRPTVGDMLRVKMSKEDIFTRENANSPSY
ncbi:MAG: hypothetical protein DRN78_04550 [Thermoproteota archaeon]|nr:MAG: hypothetical protein DRN78_04550 [Candidatus Korarchaeota archaeon]